MAAPFLEASHGWARSSRETARIQPCGQRSTGGRTNRAPSTSAPSETWTSERSGFGMYLRPEEGALVTELTGPIMESRPQ